MKDDLIDRLLVLHSNMLAVMGKATHPVEQCLNISWRDLDTILDAAIELERHKDEPRLPLR